jgi:hypothetical protein
MKQQAVDTLYMATALGQGSVGDFDVCIRALWDRRDQRDGGSVSISYRLAVDWLGLGFFRIMCVSLQAEDGTLL